MLVVSTSWPIKRITVCTLDNLHNSQVKQVKKMAENFWQALRRKWNSLHAVLITTQAITHHRWQPLFANFWWITHPFNRPCICRQNSQSFKASFEVSILGSLDMNILKGMIKTIIEFGFCMIWRIIQIYSTTLQYLLLFVSCRSSCQLSVTLTF